ncbi:hypothetical protein N7486_006319 [Penicillium sp. IBT 16267x]|nr:hypothetical protein N7486_006319 [Penicillium sp. IBT 16267x]
MAHLFHPGQFHMASQKYNGRRTPRCVMAEKRHFQSRITYSLQSTILSESYNLICVEEFVLGLIFVGTQPFFSAKFKIQEAKNASETNPEISTCDVVKLRGLLQEQDCGGTALKEPKRDLLLSLAASSMDISKARNAVFVRKSAWRPER